MESPMMLLILDLVDNGIVEWMIYNLSVSHLCSPSENKFDLYHSPRENFTFVLGNDAKMLSL